MELLEPTPDPILTAAWPVADPFALALWLGALAAAAHRHPGHLDGELDVWAGRCLAHWPARGQA
jgi:hypothetical protein